LNRESTEIFGVKQNPRFWFSSCNNQNCMDRAATRVVHFGAIFRPGYTNDVNPGAIFMVTPPEQHSIAVTRTPIVSDSRPGTMWLSNPV
jgi:hypothetical protein